MFYHVEEIKVWCDLSWEYMLCPLLLNSFLFTRMPGSFPPHTSTLISSVYSILFLPLTSLLNSTNGTFMFMFSSISVKTWLKSLFWTLAYTIYFLSYTIFHILYFSFIYYNVCITEYYREFFNLYTFFFFLCPPECQLSKDTNVVYTC